jgi:hypothetical protein
MQLQHVLSPSPPWRSNASKDRDTVRFTHPSSDRDTYVLRRLVAQLYRNCSLNTYSLSLASTLPLHPRSKTDLANTIPSFGLHSTLHIVLAISEDETLKPKDDLRELVTK